MATCTRNGDVVYVIGCGSRHPLLDLRSDTTALATRTRLGRKRDREITTVSKAESRDFFLVPVFQPADDRLK